MSSFVTSMKLPSPGPFGKYSCLINALLPPRDVSIYYSDKAPFFDHPLPGSGFNIDPNSFAMRTKLWRIHALNSGYAIAEISCICHKQCVFENIGPFAKIAKEEIRAGIFSTFVIPQPILPFIAAQYIYRFHGGCPHIFHMHIFHIAIDS